MKRWASGSLLLLFAVSCKAPTAKPLRVAAAADLAHAFGELGPAFGAQSSTPLELKLTFGATGLLARQITQGAPFDLFLAANLGYVEQVVKAGACDATSVRSYGRGRLVIWVKGTGGAELTLAALLGTRFAHIAIANPEHAPYGKAAREALTRAGAWNRVSQRLVYGENVQQAFELAQSGNADVAIVGLSQAIGTTQGSWAMIDEGSYAPIEQALVVCKNGTNAPGARRLAAFLEAPAGRAILSKFGFSMPGEALAKTP